MTSKFKDERNRNLEGCQRWYLLGILSSLLILARKCEGYIPSLASKTYNTKNERIKVSASSSPVESVDAVQKKAKFGFSHTLAILTFPKTAIDKIANEYILERAIAATKTSGKLSVVLRCRDNMPHRTPLNELCSFIGEVYSHAWDIAVEKIESEYLPTLEELTSLEKPQPRNLPLLDVVVYPQSLPNAAPEHWIYHRLDLDCICGANDMMGWHSTSASEIPYVNQPGAGKGGLQSHVDAVNADRHHRGLKPVHALQVELPDGGRPHPDVLFLEDDRNPPQQMDPDTLPQQDMSLGLLGGARLDDGSLFQHVCVGGTFDGMHYGHRKLLTLAVASVDPQGGRLVVGVTTDEMLQHKELAEFIPPLKERMQCLTTFLDALAPGLKNRRKVVPIYDEMGPTATDATIDALVLSHETLPNGHRLNQKRIQNGLSKLKLLCTRRTEQNSMSSTALRRLKEIKTSPTT